MTNLPAEVRSYKHAADWYQIQEKFRQPSRGRSQVTAPAAVHHEDHIIDLDDAAWTLVIRNTTARIADLRGCGLNYWRWRPFGAMGGSVSHESWCHRSVKTHAICTAVTGNLERQRPSCRPSRIRDDRAPEPFATLASRH